MAVYYIRPFVGNDNNGGLSWSDSWQSLRGFRVSSIVPVAGDEIRFEKSEQYSLGSKDYVYAGYSTIEWTVPGVSGNETRMYSGEYGTRVGSFITCAVSSDFSRVTVSRGTPVSGAATADRSWSGATVFGGYSSAGGMNAADALLFGINVYLPGGSLSGKSRLSGQIRCTTPYAGTGDVDMPAGTLSIVLRNGTTVVSTIVVDTIVRNSAEDWTPFEIDFTALPTTSVTSVWVSRTSVALNRDNSPFGLEVAALVLASSDIVRAADTAFTFSRTAATNNIGYDAIGTNDMRVVAEQIDYWDTYNGQYTVALSVSWSTSNARIDTSTLSQLKICKTPLAWVGSGGLSPAGSKGVYDLNGSLGGTPSSPIKLIGGWDVATDTVTGITGFSGGLTAQFGSTYALFDLDVADYVRIENISAHYGFSSLIARAKNVEMYKCSLPFSLSPAFGTDAYSTNVYMESMYVAPMVMDGWGVIGNLSLVDVYAQSPGSSATDRRSECADLYMQNSYIGTDSESTSPKKMHYVRGNAVMDGCLLGNSMCFSSCRFGNTLIFRNHKPYPSTSSVSFIFTDTNSKWDLMLYEDVSTPTYAFSSTGLNRTSTDAMVVVGEISMLDAPNPYMETSLRGSHSRGVLTDGINNFHTKSQYITNSGPSTSNGHRYTHMVGGQFINLVSPGSYLPNYGSVSTQPWMPQEDAVTNATSFNADPPLTATSLVHLAKKLDAVSYRKDLEAYVVSARIQYSSVPMWVTLKAIYVPSGGAYRAHFGFMGERLVVYASSGSSGYILYPVTAASTGTSGDGRMIGRLGVYSNAMVGATKVVAYYEAREADVTAGLAGNTGLDEWRDVYIDFYMASAGLVELRHGGSDDMDTTSAIFDTLEVYGAQ